MIKYEYVVLKNFSIFKEENGIRRLAKPEEKDDSSSDFEIGNMYVDYRFPDYEIQQCDLTETLIKEKYIKLVE